MWPARSVIDIAIDLVEMVEDARLVRADVLAGLRVAHVPRVAGEVDPRVGVEHLRGRQDRVLYFALSNQNIVAKKESGLGTWGLADWLDRLG